MSKVKCRGCKKEIERDTAYSPKPKMFYCDENCAPKPKEIKVVEKSPRVEFTDYIQNIYLENGWQKHKIPWQMIMSQTKNMMQENESWKYEGMQYVLWYMHYISDVDIFSEESNGSILTLMPFYYEEAKEFYEKSLKIEEKVESIELGEVSIVKIKKKYENKVYKEVSFDL